MWESNEIKFARLLAEIWAMGLDKDQKRVLQSSMGISQKELKKLFKRAKMTWKKFKKELRAYDWAFQQGYTGAFVDWLQMPASVRQEYEDGAQGIGTT